jgi:hypothetical protein
MKKKEKKPAKIEGLYKSGAYYGTISIKDFGYR